MKFIQESLVSTFYYFMALVFVLLGYNTFSSLNQDAEDFLYLSEIVKTATTGKKTQVEQIKALTEWLATNVVKTTEFPGWERSGYPDWFDGSSVASVIKGGIGNCGYQANNIITLSRYLGVKEHRRYWVGKASGSEHEHAFVEMIVDGKAGVFDPNILLFHENKIGEVLSLKTMIQDPSVVENESFRKIVTEIRDKPSIVRMTNIPVTPEPLGQNSYIIYLAIGKIFTEMYLHLKRNPITIIVLTWLVFIGASVIHSTIIKRITRKNL